MFDRLARRPLLQLWIVAVAAALVYLPFLGTRPLDFSEGHRAVPGWTMLESHDYWHVRMFGLTYIRKPPGMPWAIAASSSIFGETPFAARLPSALAAMLMSGIAWWYGRRWFGGVGGLVAGLAQALMPLMWSPGRTAEIEMLNNLGTQMCALGLVHLLIGQSRKTVPSEEDEGPFGFVLGLCASTRDCLLPAAGILIAALAKGPASAPVLGGVIIGACIAVRSLRPLRAPGFGVCLTIAACVLALLGMKIYIANSDPGAVREDVAGQFLWSAKRLLGVLTLIPIAFASALPLSLSLLVPKGTSNDRGDREGRIARTFAWSWLISLAILVLCGVSNARYAMPAAVLLPPLVPLALHRMAERARASSATGLRRSAIAILTRPAFWLGALLMGGWWFIAFTATSPTHDQLAGPAAAVAIASGAKGGELWADDAIEARPDVLWLANRESRALRIRWAKTAMHRGELPAPGSFILLRTDSASTELARFESIIHSTTLIHHDDVRIRNYVFSLYEVRWFNWPLPP